ncbi:MAG: imidazole glycerol phosphate synthase subunit HisH [Thermoproteales archaeon]|nr:imidazole glycerol phosphate synthase subunit HisH [Thermoproteales archaeon]
MKFTILDYSVGNLFSITNAFRKEGIDTVISSSIRDLYESDAIILPGVGSFPAAMKKIKDIKKILIEIKKEKYFLGVCLGLQLFFENSTEGRTLTQGLGFLEGRVDELPDNVKKPHMGWNKVNDKGSILLEDVDFSYFYFAHSYIVFPKDKEIIRGSTYYGVEFPSIIEKDNIFGTQFHPEKSGRDGRKVIKNFIRKVRG